MNHPELKDRKLWIAADPGATGGAAILSDNGDLVIIKSEAPLGGYADTVAGLSFEAALIEEVGPWPGDTPTTAFRLGASYGIWQVQLRLVSPTIRFVRPQRWQTRFARQFGERWCPKDRKERKKWIQDMIKTKLEPKQAKLVTRELADCVALAWLLREGVLDD